jgi:hypothetical protein
MLGNCFFREKPRLVRGFSLVAPGHVRRIFPMSHMPFEFFLRRLHAGRADAQHIP